MCMHTDMHAHTQMPVHMQNHAQKERRMCIIQTHAAYVCVYTDTYGVCVCLNRHMQNRAQKERRMCIQVLGVCMSKQTHTAYVCVYTDTYGV